MSSKKLRNPAGGTKTIDTSIQMQEVKATNPSLFTVSPDHADLLGLARQTGDLTGRSERKKAAALLAARP